MLNLEMIDQIIFCKMTEDIQCFEVKSICFFFLRPLYSLLISLKWPQPIVHSKPWFGMSTCFYHTLPCNCSELYSEHDCQQTTKCFKRHAFVKLGDRPTQVGTNHCHLVLSTAYIDSITYIIKRCKIRCWRETPYLNTFIVSNNSFVTMIDF
jgi:hypothetical protein